MKIRTKLVSNSSSSSFIVYGEGETDKNVDRNIRSYIHRHIEGGVFKYNPHTGFGWNFEIFNDWMSKFDWAFLQMYYHLYDHEYTYYYDTMLEFLRYYHPEIERIETKYFKNDYDDEDEFDEPDGYIDHQSIGGDNASILEDFQSLYYFIVSDKSFICCQNDNSDWYWKVVDGVPTKTKYEGQWG